MTRPDFGSPGTIFRTYEVNFAVLRNLTGKAQTDTDKQVADTATCLIAIAFVQKSSSTCIRKCYHLFVNRYYLLANQVDRLKCLCGSARPVAPVDGTGVAEKLF